MRMLLLGSQIEEIAGVIISNDDVQGILVNDMGEQQGPVFFASSHAEMKKRATDYFIKAGGHNIWQNGLELRIRI